MSDPKHSTQSSTPRLPALSTCPQPRSLASPTSHYRKLYSGGRKGREMSKISLLSPIVSESPAGPPERSGNEHHQPAQHPNAATYTYEFGRDFATSDDRIDSDATDDCSYHDPFETTGDSCSFPHPQPQVQPMEQRQLDDFQALGPPHAEIQPPPREFQNKKRNPGPMEKRQNTRRQLSLKLGTTPRSVRQMDRDSLQMALSDADSDLEELGLPSLSPTSQDKHRYEIIPTPESEGDPFETPQPKSIPLGSATKPRERPIHAIACNSRSTSTENEEESDTQYSVSDAILYMHELMGRPFWADEEWLANSRRVVPRGPVRTPFSDEMIERTTRLNEVVERIRAKRGKLEQARLASAMSHRINQLVSQIRAACTTIWQHFIANQQQQANQKLHLHEETVLKMREYVIPRLVLALSKTFTLLRNQAREMRRLVISVLGRLCFSAERIARIIEMGTEKNYDGGSEKVAEVEEFIDCLAVVRDWAEAEQKTNKHAQAKRYIAL